MFSNELRAIGSVGDPGNRCLGDVRFGSENQDFAWVHRLPEISYPQGGARELEQRLLVLCVYKARRCVRTGVPDLGPATPPGRQTPQQQRRNLDLLAENVTSGTRLVHPVTRVVGGGLRVMNSPFGCKRKVPDAI